MSGRPCVVIESPFANSNETLFEENKKYLANMLRDSCNRGEAPFASHGFYTHFLEDCIPTEREIGIACNLAWIEKADYVVFCIDRGMSAGMIEAFYRVVELGKPFTFRSEYDKLDSRIRNPNLTRPYPEKLRSNPDGLAYPVDFAAGFASRPGAPPDYPCLRWPGCNCVSTCKWGTAP